MGKQTSTDQFYKNIAKEMNDTKKWIAKRTAKKMRNKLIQVYDELITKFYSRPPEEYVRHDVEKPYTEEGVNLYKALQSHGGEPSRLQPSPHSIDGGIMIDAKDMNETNYGVSRDIVLDFIINGRNGVGVRFPHRYGWMTFESSYEDGECKASGTIMQVLESVRDQLAGKYSNEAKEEAKKELKLKYISID